MVRLLGLVVVFLPIFVGSGCAHMAQVAEDISRSIERCHDHYATQRELKRQCREAEHAKQQACEQKQLAQIARETVPHLRTEMKTTVRQRVVLGQPQVDMGQLKSMMAKIDEDNKAIREMRAKLEDEYKRQHLEQQKAYMQGMLAKLSGEKGCGQPLPCPPPELPAGLPEERAMLPTEIPLNIPARLEFYVEGAEYEKAEVEHLPSLPAQLPVCQPPGPEQKGQYSQDESDQAGPIGDGPPVCPADLLGRTTTPQDASPAGKKPSYLCDRGNPTWPAGIWGHARNSQPEANGTAAGGQVPYHDAEARNMTRLPESPPACKMLPAVDNAP